MNDEKSNCCNSGHSDCNTQKTNCCSTERNSISNKKKAGLGILLLSITFALVSAFTTNKSSEKISCAEETSCETSCDAGSTESSCCSK